MRQGIGLDFGTTNSALAVADEARNVTLANYPIAERLTETFRSILYFHPEAIDSRRSMTAIAGPEAIAKYLEADGTGRLIQSLKSYVADDGFESTNIFNRNYSLIDLLTFLVREIKRGASRTFADLRGTVVVGRPVVFSGGENAVDDAFAEKRLREAIKAAGFDEVVFEYEPVAAAHFYEMRLDHDELVLIADFGGGTSDFSLVRVGPKAHELGPSRILGNDGVPIAGDLLDAKILHHIVAPALGLGTSYRSMLGKELTVPVWLYAKLRRWHHLSFLKSKRTTEMLKEILDQTSEKSKIQALLHVIHDDLGYHLYRAVEQTKVALSSNEKTIFRFQDGNVDIEAEVSRQNFERWIGDETSQMSSCVDRLLASANIKAGDIDRVFMTGGTSFVPAVRRIFTERFGAEKLESGGEMVSVASGLALRGLSLG